MWDGVAERLRLSLGIDLGEAEDPRVVAALCGIRLAPSRMIGAAMCGGALYYDASAPLAQRKSLVAMELGRWALGREGMPAFNAAARYVGEAICYGTSVLHESGAFVLARHSSV